MELEESDILKHLYLNPRALKTVHGRGHGGCLVLGKLP